MKTSQPNILKNVEKHTVYVRVSITYGTNSSSEKQKSQAQDLKTQ